MTKEQKEAIQSLMDIFHVSWPMAKNYLESVGWDFEQAKEKLMIYVKLYSR